MFPIINTRNRHTNRPTSIGAKIAAAFVAIIAGTQVALAQSAIGTAAADAVGDVQLDVNGVLTVLVIVVFLLVAWTYLKKAR